MYISAAAPWVLLGLAYLVTLKPMYPLEINKAVIFCTKLLCVARRLDLWGGNAR
jgi:hypothetical protein